MDDGVCFEEVTMMNWLRCDVNIWERGIPKLPKPVGNAGAGGRKWYVLAGSWTWSWSWSFPHDCPLVSFLFCGAGRANHVEGVSNWLFLRIFIPRLVGIED